MNNPLRSNSNNLKCPSHPLFGVTCRDCLVPFGATKRRSEVARCCAHLGGDAVQPIVYQELLPVLDGPESHQHDCATGARRSVLGTEGITALIISAPPGPSSLWIRKKVHELARGVHAQLVWNIQGIGLQLLSKTCRMIENLATGPE